MLTKKQRQLINGLTIDALANYKTKFILRLEGNYLDKEEILECKKMIANCDEAIQELRKLTKE